MMLHASNDSKMVNAFMYSSPYPRVTMASDTNTIAHRVDLWPLTFEMGSGGCAGHIFCSRPAWSSAKSVILYSFELPTCMVRIANSSWMYASHSLKQHRCCPSFLMSMTRPVTRPNQSTPTSMLTSTLVELITFILAGNKFITPVLSRLGQESLLYLILTVPVSMLAVK